MAPKTKNTEQVQEKAVVPIMPDYMKAFMAQNQADVNSLASASLSIPRLSYRGKRWRWVLDGVEEVEKTLTVDVIIVGVEPDAGRFVKTLYLSAYTPGDNTPPDCSSSNGVNPDSWVTNPQSPRCQQCPKNVFGSATARDGKGKAKACHDSKRLWVVKPDDLEVVYGLNVPIMSLKNLSEYGKYIAKNQFPLALVVTRLSMDDDSEFPKLCFNHIGFVEQEQAEECIKLNQEKSWKSNIAIPYDGPATGTMALPPASSMNDARAAQSTPQGVPQNGIERKQGTESIDNIIGNWGG